MSKWVIGLIGTGVVGALVTIMVALSIIGMNNSAVTMEKEIEAQYTQNQNSRSQMVNSIAEVAQVPELYKDDYKEVLTAAVTGTYGEGGSKAVFQWIKERDIDFSPDLYTKIQTMVESLRAQFAHEQELLIDKKRLYETKLEKFPGVFVYRILGFPKIDLDKFKVVVSQDNAKVFAEGVEAPMSLR